MGSFRKLLENILAFDIGNITSVITIAILMCMLIVLAEKSIYASSIEILFMSKKEKNWNDFLAVLVAGGLFTLANGLIILFCPNQEGLLIAFVLLIVFLFRFLKYFCILQRTRKCRKDIRRLISYYEEKQYESMIFLCFMIIILTIYIVGKNENVWSYAIIGALIELAIVMLLNPYNGGIRTSNCYKKNNEKFYIYKKMGTKSFLCGNAAEINNATWYKIVEADDINKEKIYHEVYHSFSKEEKKELRKIYKEDLKQQRSEGAKGKIWYKVKKWLKHE